MTARKTIRFLGITFTLLALVILATGVVSDWNHQGSLDDARCPYCHLGHQTAAKVVVAPSVSLLKPVAYLPPSVDIIQVTSDTFSPTAPRAPPV